MTLQASGPIGLADIAAELQVSATGLSLDNARVRKLLNASLTGGTGIGMLGAYGQTVSPYVVNLGSFGANIWSYNPAPINSGSIDFPSYKGLNIRELSILAEPFPGPFNQLILIVPNGFSWSFFQFQFELNSTLYTPTNGSPPDTTSFPGLTKYVWGGSFVPGSQARDIKFITA